MEKPVEMTAARGFVGYEEDPETGRKLRVRAGEKTMVPSADVPRMEQSAKAYCDPKEAKAKQQELEAARAEIAPPSDD